MEPLTRDTITRLSLRGLVALAARCARRAQPVFRDWNSMCGSPEHEEAVEAAIGYAEAYARGTEEPHELAGGGDRLVRAADVAAEAARKNNAFEIGKAAESAALAAKAAVNATDSAQGQGPE